MTHPLPPTDHTLLIPEDAIFIEDDAPSHLTQIENLLTQTLHLITQQGHTLLNPTQCAIIAKLLSHLPHLYPIRTSHHLAWPLSIPSHPESTLHVCLPLDPAMPGALHILRAPHHKDTHHAHI